MNYQPPPKQSAEPIDGDRLAGSLPPQIALPRRTPDGKRHVPNPRSDLGTIILHWLATAAVIASLVTGLRLSADEGSWFARAIVWILPQGEIWTPHIIAALALVVSTVGYVLYMKWAHLGRRISTKKTIVLTLKAAPKLYWGAINVILHWIMFAAIVVMLVTGVGLYIGYGGWWVTIHYAASLLTVVYLVAHSVSHFMYGGLQQWLRLFRVARPTSGVTIAGRLIVAALVAGVLVAGATAAVDYATRDTLYVARVATAPQLDRLLDDPVWRDARPVSIRTQQGANLGGTGESTVELRAVTAGDKIYFAVRWEDPTRSLRRVPLIKQADGWHLLHTGVDIADESIYYEDKFSLMFSRSAEFGSGDSTHMGPKPLGDKPPAKNGRGYHYTTDGSLIDIWQWKSARAGMLGLVDDMWFGPPVNPTPDDISGASRYQAGYDADKGKSAYLYNYVKAKHGGVADVVEVRRLPKDYKAMTAKLGHYSLDPDASDEDGAQWWMLQDAETVPYSAEKDAEIPVGTVMPSVLITGPFEGHRGDVLGASKWADGHWTLTMSRDLDTHDVQDLPMASGLYLWVAVFDHAQTRHTRHMRPVRMELR